MIIIMVIVIGWMWDHIRSPFNECNHVGHNSLFIRLIWYQNLKFGKGTSFRVYNMQFWSNQRKGVLINMYGGFAKSTTPDLDDGWMLAIVLIANMQLAKLKTCQRNFFY